MAWEPPGAAPSSPREWEARVRGVLRALGEVQARAAASAKAERDSAREQQRRAYERAAASATEAHRRAEETARQQATTARACAARSASGLAPGLASADFDAVGWTTTEFVGTGTPEYLRVGTVAPDAAAPVPVVYPLFGSRGWQLLSDNVDDARGFLQGVLLRTVGTADPTRLRVDVYDPRLTGTLGVLGRLTEQAPAVLPPALHSAEELAVLLADLVATSSRRATTLAQLGHRDFAAWLAASPQATEPFRLVVLLDYPSGIDRRANAELVRVAESAHERGLCLLVHHDETVAPDVDAHALLDQLRPVVLEGDEVGITELDTLQVRRDPRPEAAFSGSVCDVAAGIARRSRVPNADALDTPATNTGQLWDRYVSELRTLAQAPADRDAQQRCIEQSASEQRATADGHLSTAERTERRLAERAPRIDDLADRAGAEHGIGRDGEVLDVLAPDVDSAKAGIELLDLMERQLRADLDSLERARRRSAEHRRKLLVLAAVAAIVLAGTVLILVAAL